MNPAASRNRTRTVNLNDHDPRDHHQQDLDLPLPPPLPSSAPNGHGPDIGQAQAQDRPPPPLLRVAPPPPQPADDNAFELTRGDILASQNASSSLSPPAAAGAGMASSSSASSSKPKRKRSMIACKYCNERRVRCDGSTIGLPCSNCQHAGKTDSCEFIESRRVRGAHGRFESRDGKGDDGLSPTAPPTRRARRHSISGTDGEEWRRLLQNSASISRTTTGPVTYLGESWPLSWVIHPNASGERPLHLRAILLPDESKDMANRVNKELWEKGAYILPRPEIRDQLISEYFEMCHPNHPIISKRAFLHSLRTNTFSHLLVQSVLLVASAHCDLNVLQRGGYTDRREAAESFYARARLLFDGDVEPDKITSIQSMFLLQFWWRSVTDHKDTLWWLAGAVRMAQNMGLHRSTAKTALSIEDKRLWRRVWWMLYLRDRFAASHLGKPMVIRDEDCDVEPLDLADFDEDCPKVHAIYAQEQIRLAQLIPGIIACEFSPGTIKDAEDRSRCREQCHAALSEWQKSLPPEITYSPNSHNIYAMYLQMAFLTQLLLLNRPAMYVDPSVPDAVRHSSERIATNASNAITKIADDLVTSWGSRYMPQHVMSCLFAAMTVQMVARRSLDPVKRVHADAKLQQNLKHLESLSKILPLAGWTLTRFLRILERQGVADEARTAPLSPPATTALTSGNIQLPVTPSIQKPAVPETIPEVSETAWTQEMESMSNMPQIPAPPPGYSIIRPSGHIGDGQDIGGMVQPVGLPIPGADGAYNMNYQWMMDNVNDPSNQQDSYWWTNMESGGGGK